MFTEVDRGVLVFERATGDHHFIHRENWDTAINEAAVETNVELGTADLDDSQREVLIHWL